MTPEGWDRRRIGELVTNIGDGGTPRRDNPSYFGGDVPWVVIQDIKPLITVTKNTLTKEGLDACSAKLWPKNSVILSTGATIGEVGIAGVPLATKQGITGMVCEEYVIPKFLYYLLQQKKQYLQTLAQGSTIREVRPPILKKIDITLPPKIEQKKIAAILSSVDDAIQATQAVIDQTSGIKQGLMQHLFTCGIEHIRFKQTEVGEIPEKWTLKTVKEVCSKVSVGIVIKPTQYYVPTGIQCFRSANVREGFVEDRNWIYISEDANNLNAKSKLRAGDVLIVRTGYPGTSCVVPKKYEGTNCVDIIFARPKVEVILSHYLSWFINSPLGKKQVLRGQGGLAQKHFNVNALNQMKIAIPSIDEQKKIIDILSWIQSCIQQGEKEVNNLLTLKNGLMQDLLTGRVRVKHTEEATT